MYRGENLVGELAEYVKKNLKKGYTRDSLRWALISQGYSRLEVDKALRKADVDMAKDAPVLRTKPEIKYEAVPVQEEEKKGFWKKFFG